MACAFSESAIDPVPITFLARVPDVNLDDRLSSAARMFEGMIAGPECIISVRGVLYTGSLNGTIFKIKDGVLSKFAQLGPADCFSMETCGRPLGLHYDETKDRILVADAYLGLFALDLSTGKPTKIFPRDGSKMTLFNALTTLPDGRIVLSESSQKFQLKELIYDFLEGRPTGRLLLIDPNSGEWRVLADNLFFANGVVLHADGNSVLVAETGNTTIRRVSLNGGPSEVFTDQLPGMPDNLSKSPRGGYWVSLVESRLPGKTNFYVAVAKYPWIRYLCYKFIPLRLLRSFANLNSRGLIVRIDDSGRIVESLYDPSGNIFNVADVLELDGVLWLGSYYANFVGKFVL